MRSRIWLILLALLVLSFDIIACNNSTTDVRPGTPYPTPGVPGTTAPVITGGIQADTAAPVTGQNVVFSVNATDPDGGVLTYVWSDGGAGGTFVGTGPNVAWKVNEPGNYVITVTVRNQAGLETMASFNVTVTAEPTGGNLPPVINSLTASTTNPLAGEDVALTVDATDPEGGALTYEWMDDDEGASGVFTGSGAAVSWKSDSVSAFIISVKVTDNGGLVANASILIKVRPANNAPTFPAAMTADVANPVATQSIKFTAKAVDEDGDTLTYTWDASVAGTFSNQAVAEDGTATAFFKADAEGTLIVTVTADDGNGGTAEVSLERQVAVLPTTFGYVGYTNCFDACHSSFSDVTQAGWLTTAHSKAFETSLAGRNMTRAENCYVCHAVGYAPVGSGGFIDLELTPQFANIQCESCHGTGVGHPANGKLPAPYDPSLGYARDGEGNLIEVDGAFQYDENYDGSMGYGCGLCHEGKRHGAFEEWIDSGHGAFQLYLEDGVTPEHYLTNTGCVKCHNGYYFVDMTIRGNPAPSENLTVLDEGSTHISCAVCHDPHDDQFDAQLRIDSAGTRTIPWNSTVVSGGLGNTCIECHNGRRTPTDLNNMVIGNSPRGMHGNGQGSLLYGLGAAEIGSLPYDKDHPHATWTTDSCVSCHMYRKPFASYEDPQIWGHTFEPRAEACLDCHVGTAEDVWALTDDFQADIEGLLAQIETLWPVAWKDTATTPPTLRFRDADPSDGTGPPRNDPTYGDLYRQVWWNYDYIGHESSYGVHNPRYAKQVLQASVAQLIELNAITP